jgi:hypothetical protein
MNAKLREHVRRVMQERGLTVYRVAQGSGGRLSTDRLDDIRQARAENLSDSEMEGLAKGLGESADYLRSLIDTP